MRNTRHRIAGHLIPIWFLLVATAAFGQRLDDDWRLCDTCFKGFDVEQRTGGRLPIGGESIWNPGIAIDSLNMTFGYYYGGPVSLARISAPARWWPCPEGRRWRDSIDHIFWRDAADRGFRVYYSPADLFQMWRSALSAEYYHGVDPAHIRPQEYAAGWRASGISYPMIPRNFVSAVTMPAASDDSTLIAGRQQYTSIVMQEGEHRFYDTLRNYNGAYADSTHYFDISLTLHIETDDEIFEKLAPTDTIAYAILYRREDTLQRAPGACACDWAVPFERLAVTKETYVNASGTEVVMGEPPSGLPYRTVTFPVNFLRDSIKASDADGNPIRIADVVESRVGCEPTTLDTIALRDSVPRYMVLYGNPLRGPDTDPACVDRCDSLFAALRRTGHINPNTIQADPVPVRSDFFFDIYTTNRIPLTFLRSRIGSHLLTIVERGGLDTMIRRIVDGVLTDTTWNNALSRLTAQFSLNDEPREGSYGFYRTVSSRVQRFTRERDSTRNSGIFSNPYWDFNTFRAFGGDYDTLSRKMIGTWMEHLYPIEGPLPIGYANPDSMHGGFGNGWYGKLIATSTDTGYAAYTLGIREKLGIKKRSIREAVDVARFRYLHLAPPHPVMTNVQVGGWLFFDYETGRGRGYLPGFRDGRRPTTPEEIIAQSWLALHCGVDGIMYSDMIYDGNHFGPIHHTSGEHSGNYDTLQPPMPFPPFTDTLFRIPKMWTGMEQRFTAIREITNEIRRIDTIYSKLIYDREALGVDDTTLDFSSVPLVDSLFAIRAKRYMPYDPDTGFADSTADPRSETYMEITQLNPDPADAERSAGVRYLLVTNLRCWPVETMIADGRKGLGAIDARRPVVLFNNITGIEADSFVVEWVGHESEWRDTAAFNEPAALRWLKPGWGAMYRIIPIPISRPGNGSLLPAPKRRVPPYSFVPVPSGSFGSTMITSSRSITTEPGFAPFGLRTYFLRV